MKSVKQKHSGNHSHQEEKTITSNPSSPQPQSFKSKSNQEQTGFLGSTESLIKSQELAHVGSWEWDIPADKITWSPELYRIYDIDPQTQLNYNKLMEKIHPEDRDYYDKIMNNWTKKRQGGPFEYRILRSDGSTRFVHGESEISCDDAGNPTRISGIVQDITDRKQAEEELEKHRHLLEILVEERTTELTKTNDQLSREITKREQIEDNLLKEKSFSEMAINSLPGVFYLVGEQGKILRHNKNAEKVTGYSDEEISKLSVFDFLAEEDRKTTAEKIQEVLTSGEATMEACLLTKDKKRIPYFFTGSRMNMGNEQYIVGMAIDITERKLMEESLRESEEKLRSMFDNMQDVSYRTDKEGKVIWASPSAAHMLGYQSTNELLGCNLARDLYASPEQRQTFLERLAEKGVVTDYEVELKKKDGSTVIVSTNSHYYRDKKGQIAGVEGVCRDVTERRQTEKALRESEERWRSLAQNSPDIIIVIDRDWNIQYINYPINDFTPEKIIGTHISNYIPNKFWPGIEERYKKVWRTGKADKYEMEYYAEDGSFTVYFEARVGPMIQGDKVVALIINASDITERKLIAKKLEAERQKLFSILDGLGAFVYVQAPDYSIHYTNKHFKKLFGEAKDKICYEILWNRKAPCNPCPTFRVFDTKKSQKWEWACPKDGHVYQVYDQPFQDLDGSPLVLELGIDITERKIMEEELRARQKEIEELNTNLEVRVQEEVEMSRQKDYLMIQQSRLAAMGEMIRFITHQWGQPLWALQLLFHNIEDLFENVGVESEDADNFISAGLKLVKRMFTTMDDFKSFFQADKEKVIFSINKCIKDTLSLIGASFEYSNIPISLNEKEELMALGFPNEFSQVILNILKNSKDAIGEKGIKGKIKMDFLREGDFAIVRIKDNGGGIPDDLLDKIFDSYFTTKKEGKGTGIGLYLSRIIVEDRMNGSINAKNTKQGAQFEIILPIVQS